MSKTAAAGLAALAMTIIAATPAAAQGTAPGRWSMTVAAGTTAPLTGLYHEAGTGTVLQLATTVQARDWSDIYRRGAAMRLGFGYAATRHAEVTATFAYSRQDAEELSVGTVAGLDLRSKFANSREWGLEGGLRWRFAPDARVVPFVAVAAGLRRIDAMPATFSVPAAGVVLANTPFYTDSTVPTFGGDVGVRVAIGSRIWLGVETGPRWTGNLEDVEGLAGTGLENLNDSSRRWTMPILGTFTVGF